MSSGPSSPAQIHRRRDGSGSSTHNPSHHGGYDSEDGPSRSRDSGNDPDKDRRRRRRHHRHNPSEPRASSPSESDSTVELPDRFDERGKRIPERGEDDFVEKFQSLLDGRGSLGTVLQSFGLGGGSDDNDNDNDGDRRRRRRRR